MSTSPSTTTLVSTSSSHDTSTAALNYPSSTSNPTTFTFPAIYSYPPFFTLQPILPTRLSQLTSWSALIQSYCAHHRLFSLSLTTALACPLFSNQNLRRQLSARDARAIVDWMASKEGDGRAEWIPSAPGKKLSTEDDGSARFYVFWRKPEEWASDIEAWVDATAQRGVVLTLYELGEGDATRGEAWHGMEAELLARVLGISGRRGRAQVFGKEGGEGVKFF